MSFKLWCEARQERADSIGYFAGRVAIDEQFPQGECSKAILLSYLRKMKASQAAINVFDCAYDMYVYEREKAV